MGLLDALKIIGGSFVMLACVAGCSEPAASFSGQVPADVDGRVTINELQTANVLTVKDETGAATGWIELYNPTARDIPLRGYGVTDDLTAPLKARLPAGVVLPAGGHVVLWCDGNPSAGAAHVSIMPAAAGGSLGLARPDGSYIDRVTYGAQVVDFSVAREPDGASQWVTEWAASPGAANPGGSAPPAGVEVATEPPEAVADPGDLSERVLGYDVVPEFALEIGAGGIAALRAQPSQWVQATLVHAGRAYGPVGVNLKGTASFQSIDGKAAFRVNIDKFVKGAQFFGLKEFLLNNMTPDPSMMHERIAYWAARQAGGVPASRSNHALLTVNGQFYGLYANVEEPKGQLMARFFADASGSIYTIHYADFVPSYLPSFQLQAGPDDLTLVQGLMSALALQPADAAIVAAAPYANMHEFNRYWAICVVTGHWGGWPYAPLGEPAGANAGIYDDPQSKQLNFIVEGINDAFATSDFDPVNNAKSVLTKTCQASPSCFADFVAQVWEILAKLEQLDWVSENDRVAAQIVPYVAIDPRKPYSATEVATYQQQMRYFISGRRAALGKYLPAPIP